MLARDGNSVPGRAEIVTCTLVVILVTLDRPGSHAPAAWCVASVSPTPTRATPRCAVRGEAMISAGIARLDAFASRRAADRVYRLRDAMSIRSPALQSEDEWCARSAAPAVGRRRRAARGVSGEDRRAHGAARPAGSVNDRSIRTCSSIRPLQLRSEDRRSGHTYRLANLERTRSSAFQLEYVFESDRTVGKFPETLPRTTVWPRARRNPAARLGAGSLGLLSRPSSTAGWRPFPTMVPAFVAHDGVFDEAASHTRGRCGSRHENTPQSVRAGSPGMMLLLVIECCLDARPWCRMSAARVADDGPFPGDAAAQKCLTTSWRRSTRAIWRRFEQTFNFPSGRARVEHDSWDLEPLITQARDASSAAAPQGGGRPFGGRRRHPLGPRKGHLDR